MPPPFSLTERQYLRYKDGSRHPVSSIAVDIRVRAIRDFQRQVQKATKKSVEIGKATAESLAPVGGPHNAGERQTKLKDAIEADYTREFYAGGAGGGGNYQAMLFINTVAAPHAAYVFYGTGEHNTSAGAPRERIEYGKEVRFFWWRQKKPMRVYSISGMEPNTEWWKAAQVAAEEHLAKSIRRIDDVRGVSNANF